MLAELINNWLGGWLVGWIFEWLSAEMVGCRDGLMDAETDT